MRPTIIALLAGAALLIPAAASSARIGCGSLHGGFENHIVESGLNCKVAHKIVNMWHYRAVTKGQGSGNKNVGDFRCRSKATAPEHVKVKCTHKEFKNQWVTFFAGP
jgi:hypothetical protein